MAEQNSRQRPWLVTPLGGSALLGGLALGCAASVGFLETSPMIKVALLTAAGALGAMSVGWSGYDLLRRQRTKRQLTMLVDLVEEEPVFCFLCDLEGNLKHANVAARERFETEKGLPLASVLRDVFASSEGVVYRLFHKVQANGSATENITSHSEGFRIHVRSVPPGLVLWRLEPDAVRSGQQTRVDAPIMTLGRNGAVLFMNTPARELLGRRAKSLDEVFDDLPLRPGGVHILSSETGPQRVLVQSSEIGAGRIELVLSAIAEEDTGAETVGSFDSLPVPLIKVAPEGRVLRANPEARRMLDLGMEPLGNLSEYMEGLGRALTDWLQEAAAGKGLHRSEFLRLTRADQEVFVQVTLNRVVEDGQPTLVAVLNDATELKTLEAQFVQSQKMQAIGQLAGGVAHDFNNLLTAISGHCDLLLLRHDQGDPDYGDLVQINQNANRAAALVGQLLAFSRKQTMQPEILDLRDTLSDLAHLLNRLVGEKVRLNLHHDPVLPQVRGDRRQLEQVMMNLVVNARDAMVDGGEIAIDTERRVLREPLKRDRAIVPSGTYVSVRVNDEGSGIPQDKLQKVFEPFFTTKRTGEGTGLGLSTVYGIVKQSGGYIFVDSVVGQGTCFTLLFPAHEAAPDSKPKPKEEVRKLPQKGSGVVLLVEDEAPVRAFAARALRLRGYTVVEAENAEDALELLEDETLAVDVFVTDVVMPGMDGPTWVRKALVDRPDTRVVFVSGYAEDAFGEGSQEVPNSVFLPKPFSLSELTETVHDQFD
ncbi:ATP-binding protein [Pelagimonas varians]|uniref:histidine kinase n=2 Tax=Pelagimonas varians TaxID=696760 RepID=A0A238K7H9_9RHOB|nr:ATP-binding protein [Pelagimonas varians]PYG31668.1 two-component system cell cycle sensor histidine kinase/response regulator CckA [Pelagimonas varians]SMX38819.1 Blue-light-activated protein [Pelagimonas varians]